MFKLKHYIEKIIKGLFNRGLLCWLPDKQYLQVRYWIVFGKKLNLKDPKSYNEKLQWLKLYDRNPLYTNLVDKYEVKNYVAKIIGEKYIISTLGVWDSFDEIDFDKLPNQFVLKCTHDSGGIVICKDKSTLDKNAVKNKIESSLNKNYYKWGREWPYKNVIPRIIAERYMEDETGEELKDYKFFCFHGKPVYCQVIGSRSTNETIDFFDMEWNHMPFIGLLTKGSHETFSSTEIPKPKTLDQMIEVAKVMSKEFSFVRVDLYEINGKMYFGELTFYPASGFGKFTPEEWNLKIGDMLDINL